MICNDYIILKAYAKLNLFLEILEKQNSFHKIEFVNCELDLFDKIKIEKIEENAIIIESSNDQVPLDKKNFCYKGIQALKEKYKIECGIRISIQKNIPFIGGLGGGSSDLAKTLYGANILFGLNLSNEDLAKIALPISSDACFSIYGWTAKVEGIGEKIIPLEDIEKYHIAIITPDVLVPENKTAWMYKNFDKLTRSKINNSQNIINAIKNKEDITKFIYNAFEEVQLPEYTKVKTILNEIRNSGITASLCGSGPNIFAISKNIDKLNKLNYKKIITQTR